MNSGDSAATINKYVKEGKFAFPIVMDDKNWTVATQYGVQLYPTNYILDSKGKVVKALIGFDEASLVGSLKQMGFKIK